VERVRIHPLPQDVQQRGPGALADRFRGLGLAEEIAELRGHPARGADIDEL